MLVISSIPAAPRVRRHFGTLVYVPGQPGDGVPHFRTAFVNVTVGKDFTVGADFQFSRQNGQARLGHRGTGDGDGLSMSVKGASISTASCTGAHTFTPLSTIRQTASLNISLAFAWTG